MLNKVPRFPLDFDQPMLDGAMPSTLTPNPTSPVADVDTNAQPIDRIRHNAHQVSVRVKAEHLEDDEVQLVSSNFVTLQEAEEVGLSHCNGYQGLSAELTNINSWQKSMARPPK